MGFQVSAREALLRQVRGLQASNWQEDAVAFRSFGDALLQLGHITLGMAQTDAGQTHALASTRMQLKSTLKQAAEMHADDAVYQDLQNILDKIESAETESRQKR